MKYVLVVKCKRSRPKVLSALGMFLPLSAGSTPPRPGSFKKDIRFALADGSISINLSLFCVSTDRILSIRLQSLSMRYAVFVVVVVCALPSTWALSPDQGLRAENWSHAHDFSSQASLHHGLTKPLRGRRRFLQSAEGEDLHSAATSAAENERWHRVAQKRAERRAERLARRNANASASCTMHTYSSPLSDATSEEIAASNTLVSKWREAWEAGGWSTRVINEDDAKNHPEYDVLKAAFTALPTVTSLH